MIKLIVKTRKGKKPIVSVSGDITAEATKVRSMKSLLETLENLACDLVEIFGEGFVEGCIEDGIRIEANTEDSLGVIANIKIEEV